MNLQYSEMYTWHLFVWKFHKIIQNRFYWKIQLTMKEWSCEAKNLDKCTSANYELMARVWNLSGFIHGVKGQWVLLVFSCFFSLNHTLGPSHYEIKGLNEVPLFESKCMYLYNINKKFEHSVITICVYEGAPNIKKS